MEMKKNSLHYELYGSSTGAGNKGYWRWAIFAGHEKNQFWSAPSMARSRRQCGGRNIASERAYSESQTTSLKVVKRKLSV
jgi:hypothetical protein